MRWDEVAAVPNSVMPQGVEHGEWEPRTPATAPVPNSVMPQGVEHLDLASKDGTLQACRIQ